MIVKNSNSIKWMNKVPPLKWLNTYIYKNTTYGVGYPGKVWEMLKNVCEAGEEGEDV
jgi:hypothetical protein